MKLQGTIIPEAKLTQYLLVPRREDDKSKFLAQAGFTTDNPERLKQAIFTLIQTCDAVSDRQDKYGTYYLVEGPLIGPNGALIVVTVWIERTVDGILQFVTLKPKR
ncbi:MAG: hypothetical protein HC886_05865 [Leptolyngbyaceae cyanobacterium SM1_1_3]|nr:hypothetical protein [Leptolyngbyaceae cyanobacterium SM1_1_3]NJN04644.1 hypothetical protein [Leptolyngbyaceae cyanobacterium RM1_1_2]NJO09180.1 hypothetical protein [Leptolyngbyaceae cyanobacterium SL_1_1]